VRCRDPSPGCACLRKVWNGATIAADVAAEFVDSSVEAAQRVRLLIRAPEAPTARFSTQSTKLQKRPPGSAPPKVIADIRYAALQGLVHRRISYEF
jgi:hypothetical protein